MSSNIVLIGMPGSGKSTVGRHLAERFGYAFVDVDTCIETGEGKPLSAVLADTTLEGFIALEAEYVRQLDCRDSVISTGGSVIYDEQGMAHLRDLGVVVFLDVPLEILETRLADLPARGVVIAKGQTVADLARGRRPLYTKYADLTVTCGDETPEENAKLVTTRLSEAKLADLSSD